MASPKVGNPGRSLLVLLVLLLALGGWILISGVHTPRLGLDLKGGTTVTLLPKLAPGEEGEITDEAISEAVGIIQQRVDGSGVAEASVSALGNGKDAVIVVSVPDIAEGELLDQLGQTASLAFRPVLVEAPGTPAPTPEPSPTETKKKKDGNTNGAVAPRIEKDKNKDKTATPSPSATPEPTPTSSGNEPSGDPTSVTPADISPQLQKQFQELDCSDPKQQNIGQTFKANQIAIACSDDGAAKYVLAPVAVEGARVDDASASIPQGGLGWVVNLNFDGDGTKQFASTTQALSAQQGNPPLDQFAIVLDGVVISAPGVNEPILGGQAEISGQFTQQEAADLANVLKYGALPLAFDFGERQTVSPTLGADQLRAGLIAGGLGLLLVVVYLVLYYRALAMVAVLSLVIAGLFVYGTVILLGETLGFTLTLAGVAGLIVAIGITADSFIVYFERIRDEVREGRTLRVALEAGWSRAKRTIIAADFISLIAAVILYVLSVGGVRGFAFTLGLTTIIDLGVVFLFTKPLVTLLAQTKFFNSGSKWSGLSPERLGARPKAEASTVASRRRAAGEV